MGSQTKKRNHTYPHYLFLRTVCPLTLPSPSPPAGTAGVWSDLHQGTFIHSFFQPSPRTCAPAGFIDPSSTLPCTAQAFLKAPLSIPHPEVTICPVRFVHPSADSPFPMWGGTQEQRQDSSFLKGQQSLRGRAVITLQLYCSCYANSRSFCFSICNYH